MTNTLNAGESLRAGQQLTSSNGLYRLVMQTDGNLVLYAPQGAVWDTGTWRLPPALRPTRLDLQHDGNIVLYNATNYVGWSPNIHGRGGTRLVVQDDRNVVVYTPDGKAVWASNTWIPTNAGGAGHELSYVEESEVGFAKTLRTEVKLFRDGSMVATTKANCGAPFSGLRGRVLVVAVDGHGRMIWASQTLKAQTACSVLDVSCPSHTTTAFNEKWPEAVAQLAVRLDVFHSDNGIYDQFRKGIKETAATIKDLAPVLAFF